LLLGAAYKCTYLLTYIVTEYREHAVILISSQVQAFLSSERQRLHGRSSSRSISTTSLTLRTFLLDVFRVALRPLVQLVHKVIGVRIVQRREKAEDLYAGNLTSLRTNQQKTNNGSVSSSLLPEF